MRLEEVYIEEVNIYDGPEALLEDDIVSPEEAAFMRGYMQSDKSDEKEDID